MIHMIVTATTVNEQTNVWLKYFTTIDWDKIVGTFYRQSAVVAVFTVLFLILYRLGRFALNRTFKSYQRRAPLTGTGSKTIHALSVNVFLSGTLLLPLRHLIDSRRTSGDTVSRCWGCGFGSWFWGTGICKRRRDRLLHPFEAQFDVGMSSNSAPSLVP